MQKYCCTFIIIILAAIIPASAQLIIDVPQLPVDAINIDAPIVIHVNNTMPVGQTCFFKVSFSIVGKVVCEKTFQSPILNPGMQILNSNQLVKSSEIVYDELLRSSRVISKGTVMMCIDAYTLQDNTLIANYCTTIVLKENKENGIVRDIPIKVGGYAEITGNYTSRKGNYQELPANYTNVIINPELEAFGIPLGAKVNYSTAADRQQQNINLFTIYFDTEKFKEKLERKNTAALSKEKLFEEAEINDLTKNKEEYTKLTSILNNKIVKNDLVKLRKLDSLNKLLQDSSAYLLPERSRHLKLMRDSLSIMEAKRKGYYNLIEKHKNLTSIIRLNENPIDTAKLRDSLQVLENLLKNNRHPFTEEDDLLLKAIDSTLNSDDPKISKQRREVLKKQRDALQKRKGKKIEYENLKENYSLLHTTLEKRKKLDSLKSISGKSISLDSTKTESNVENRIKNKTTLLKSVKRFDVGFFAPQTSEYTLNGVPIRGVGLEMELKNFFFSIGGGKLQRSTIPNGFNNSPTPFSRNIFTSTIGIGKIGGNNICLQYISSNDNKETSETNDTTELSGGLFIPKSGRNKVISARLYRSFFKGRTIFEGEWAGSQITSNPTLLTENLPSSLPKSNWLQNIISQTNGENYLTGNAFNISFSQFLNKFTTKLTYSRRKVSPTYVSFGSPFLLTDILTNEFKVTQLLWKGKLNITGFYRSNSDNINSIKRSTTNTMHYGGDISIRIPNYPSLRLAYTPLIRQTQGNYFSVKMLTANSVYGWRKGFYYHQWSATYLSQESESSIGYNNFSSQSYTSNYLISFKQIINTNITASYLKQQSTNRVEGFSYGVSVGYSFRKKLTQQIGYTLTDNNLGNRNSIFYELGLSLFKNLQCKLRYLNTTYKKQDILLHDAAFEENVLIFSVLKNL